MLLRLWLSYLRRTLSILGGARLSLLLIKHALLSLTLLVPLTLLRGALRLLGLLSLALLIGVAPL